MSLNNYYDPQISKMLAIISPNSILEMKNITVLNIYNQ
jgi:hypothetical protein